MPSGILGRADLTAATDTTLYTVPASKVTTATVSFCNRTFGTARVRLALSDGATPAVADYLEFDSIVPPNGVLERTGIVIDATKLFVVRSDTAGVAVVAYGFEE